jgi:hypothetical protein
VRVLCGAGLFWTGRAPNTERRVGVAVWDVLYTKRHHLIDVKQSLEDRTRADLVNQSTAS